MASPEIALAILSVGFAYLFSTSDKSDKLFFKYLFLFTFLISAAYIYLIDYRIYGTHSLTALVFLAAMTLVIIVAFDIIGLMKKIFENMQFK
jgi:hypothetical protein